MKYLIYTAILIVFSLLIASCSLTDTPKDGRLKVYLVDSPAELDSIVINIDRVDIHAPVGDWITVNDSGGYFDLLLLTNGASVVLGDYVLNSGKYTQIRLLLGQGNYVIDNGVRHDLTIPSGYETGLKLTHQFTIEPDNLYELYLDFDASRSIEITGDGIYKLKPTIRVQAAIISGTISGTVLPLEAGAEVWTVAGTDTVSAFPDSSGFFKLMCLQEGTYQVHIDPSNPLYQSLLINNVPVVKQQNTDLGTITLTN